jgi:hypothetical protein
MPALVPAPVPAPVPALPARRVRRTNIKAPKASTADECRSLEQLPNVGPAMAADLRLLGIHTPQALKGRDGLQLYRALCVATGQRQDPCVLDTLLAVVDFMHGAPPAPWWAYTARRRTLEHAIPAIDRPSARTIP